MAEKENVVIEPATEADLDELSAMLGELFAQEGDFRPDKNKQLRGLRLIFEQQKRDVAKWQTQRLNNVGLAISELCIADQT